MNLLTNIHKIFQIILYLYNRFIHNDKENYRQNDKQNDKQNDNKKHTKI